MTFINKSIILVLLTVLSKIEVSYTFNLVHLKPIIVFRKLIYIYTTYTIKYIYSILSEAKNVLIMREL